MRYWTTAHQHFIYHLQRRYENERIPDYSTGETVVVSKENAQKRDTEREEFLEFHIALGGLLLYNQEYDLLKNILYYSNTQPPEYVLLKVLFQYI